MRPTSPQAAARFFLGAVAWAALISVLGQNQTTEAEFATEIAAYVHLFLQGIQP